MKTSRAFFAFFCAFTCCSYGATNLLLNPGFEEEGSNFYDSRYWEWNYPDTHGSNWGSFSRESWRKVNGCYEGVIRGTWCSITNGGCWQEVPATPGQTYRFTALFWADDYGNDWTSACQGVQLSFFSVSTGLLYSVSNVIDDVKEIWMGRSVEATAPSNAVWVRASIFAFGVSGNGALQFDDVSLIEIPGPAIRPGPSSRRTGVVISEIMYHPPDRTDGKNLEYVELFNTTPFSEPIGGCRLSGDIEYEFPSGTVLAAQSYLLVAKEPASIESEYGLSNVLGPFSGNLPNSSGTVRFRNEMNAVLLEIEYSDQPPWSMAADGAGHSLVLSRASFGENDPRAWSASAWWGGSPASNETVWSSPLTNVVINEFLAHTDFSTGDYIEVYNRSSSDIDLTGCYLSKTASSNQYRITGQTIGGGKFLSWMTNQFGFNLESEEGVIVFRAPNSNVIDAVQYGAQQNSVSSGRYPDGAPDIQELVTCTQGTNNSRILCRDVVINEIMYHPISEDSDDEFVELYNQGASAVDMSNWRFVDGIEFVFSEGTAIPSGGYLVVGRNTERLLQRYTNLNSGNLVGNYSGSLADGGERLALAKPDDPDLPNEDFVVVDEVTYHDGGCWGTWADGGGSSLELRDPGSDNRRAGNWADSDESGKGAWTNVTVTGVLDHGQTFSGTYIDQLHVFLLRPGECLIDNVVVSNSTGSGNLVANSTFESGLGGWTLEGNLVRSALATNGYASSRSLHIRASGGGDTGANRIKTGLSSYLWSGETVTIGARARWVSGSPYLLMRVRGNYLEATTALPVPENLGTPGAQNSRYVSNMGPAIFDVFHTPVLPDALEPVVVRAQAYDPDGIQSVRVYYHADESTTTNSMLMADMGDGCLSAVLPGQSRGQMLAFRIEAIDSNAATRSVFPADAPVRECLVRWGEIRNSTDFGTYRFWMTACNIHTWSNRAPLSDEPLDMTLAYNDERVIYNASIRYRGSPFIRTWYGEPLQGVNAYVVKLPDDNDLLGVDELNLDTLEPWEARDATRLRERLSFRIARELGLPYSNQRLVHVVLNGHQHGDVYADTQQVDSDYVKAWFPDDSDGQLFKLDDWFEFGNDYTVFVNADASLQPFTTTGGVKKKARYRWNWERKALGRFDDDYSRFFNLVDTANRTGDSYKSALRDIADIDQWMRLNAFRHVVEDWDAYGYNRGKNMFAYRPEKGRWRLLLWDMDMGLGASVEATGYSDVFTVASNAMPVIARMMAEPSFRRSYWQTVLEALNGPIKYSECNPLMDEWFYAMQYSGVAATNPAGVKSWLSTRRGSLRSQLDAVTNLAFAITSNGGSDFSLSSNTLQLTGSAPIQAREIRVNGVSYTMEWISETSWVATIALSAGTNTLTVQAYDEDGQIMPSMVDSIKVNFTGSDIPPVGSLGINEIMYNPAVTDAEFIELRNRSANAFDLFNYRIEGAGLVFTQSTVILPGEYLVLAENAPIFADTYGWDIRIAAEYSGALKNGDETLRLIKLGDTNTEDVVIDEVYYNDSAPWPTNADGYGPSLQLIDFEEDHNRVGNWAAATNGVLYTPGAANSLTSNLPPFPCVWLNELQSTNISGIRDNFNEREPWLELYNAESTVMNLTNFYLTDDYAHPDKWSFRDNADMPTDSFLVVWADAQTNQTVYMTNHVNFRLSTTTGSVALVVSNAGRLIVVDYVNYANIPADRSYGDYPDGVWSNRQVFGHVSPGATNNNAGVVALFINEWMAENDTTLIDPATGSCEDWFEIYNATTNEVDLAGYTLTDKLDTPGKWVVSNNTVIPAGGFLLVWADEEPDYPDGVHADFKLSKSGEAIGLYTSDGAPVDTVMFGVQTADISEGRWWDGQGYITNMAIPTPGSNNIVSLYNSPPVLGAIGNRTIGEGYELAFTVTAVDTDQPVQKLMFTLEAGAPSGAELNPDTGAFAWTPEIEAGSSTNTVTIRVTDNGWPAMSDSETFLIYVERVNRPPIIGAISNIWMGPGSLLIIQIGADDPDVPPDTLTFMLQPGYPEGAGIDSASGLFQWTPSDIQSSSTNLIGVKVQDDGTPVLSDTNFFTVVVLDSDSAFVAEVGATPGPDGLAIGWRAETGALYRIQYQSNLFDSAWNDLAGDVVASNSPTVIHDEAADTCPQRFYRIQHVIAP